MSETQACAAVVDDFEDHGIDAIYHDDESKTLFLVQSKLKAEKEFKQEEALAFLVGVGLILNKQFERFNQNVKTIQPQIEAALDTCDHIQLIVAYSGPGITGAADQSLERGLQALQDDDERVIDEILRFGPAEIENALREEHATESVDTRITIRKYQKLNEPRNVIFGLMPLDELADLHNRFGLGLYEKNIRYFLGSGRRGVNAAIKQTLLKDPAGFVCLNNGITMVAAIAAPRGKPQNDKSAKNIDVTGLSIVNGAQTVSTIAQFKQQHPDADLSLARVIVTLIETGADDFHKQVTCARNLQNPVDLANFAALDDVQERLRREMAVNGVEYHYRPQRPPSSGIPVMGIEELARAQACYHGQIDYAAKLKSEPGQFTDKSHASYQAIFTADLTGLAAINAVMVYRVILRLLEQAERTTGSPEKLVYKHCGYAISSLLMQHFKSKIEGADKLTSQSVETLISHIFDELRQQVFDQYQSLFSPVAPHAFFKRQPETTRLMLNTWIAYQGIAEDPAVKAKQTRLQPGDTYNQNLFHYLKGKAEQL
ncbi:AIPR family protein [Oceanobacter mangrovi]|uniref:AIPR family protein n=1 Tax=Oceanobacter mangrovi TaxID=2862510 RepID=UPI001C8DF171|nr:AIPR family protein [Oceanobacter mangrovi]